MKKLSVIFLILGIIFIGSGYYFMQSDLNSKVNTSKKDTTETNNNPKEDYGKKNLVCSQTVTQNGFSGIVYYISKFDNDTLYAMNVNYDFDFSIIPDDQFTKINELDFCTKLREESTVNKAFNNSKCSQRIENKHVYLDMELDVNNLSDSERVDYLNVETAKIALEAANYTCSVEDVKE